MDITKAGLRERATWAREQTRGIHFYSLEDEEAMRLRVLALRDTARAEQREQDAKIAQTYHNGLCGGHQDSGFLECSIAAAIRAQGGEKT